jgi:hypothetical protein
VKVPGALVNAACGAGAAALLLALTAATGAIAVNGGLGWDGQDYVRMMERGFREGTPSTRLRPVVVLINDAVDDAVFRDPVATFRAMNVVYAFLLAVVLADLGRRYGAPPASIVALVLNLFLCISVAKMFAFYPTLVDLGAYLFMAAGVLAIVSGRRLLIVVTSVLAVLSREFAVATVLFGIMRDRRRGRSVPVVAATYAPAVAAFFWIRSAAGGYLRREEAGDPVLSAGALATALLDNAQRWADPAYAVLWCYFLLTLFGGVSVALLTTSRPWKTCLRSEPEWLAFVVPLLAAAALGDVDMWRYSAFLLPAVPALWAWSLSGMTPRRQAWLLIAVTAVSVATERPWQRMDLESYFRDWFPYYVVVQDPARAAAVLWPVWRYYLAVLGVSIVALAAVRRAR